MGEACSAHGEGRGVYRVLILRERNHLQDPGVDAMIILGWICSKWNVVLWTGLSRLGIKTVGNCECGNKPSGSIKWGEFLDWLLKKDCAVWSELVSK
jgi:hypothetical protein